MASKWTKLSRFPYIALWSQPFAGTSFDTQLAYWAIEAERSLGHIKELTLGRRLLKAIAATKPVHKAPPDATSDLSDVKVLIQPRFDVDENGEDMMAGAKMIPRGGHIHSITGVLQPLTGPNADKNRRRFEQWEAGRGKLVNITSAEVTPFHKDQGFRSADPNSPATGGSVALVTWQPSLSGFAPKGGFIPPFIGLAHELIHAYHYLTGTAYTDRQTEENETVGCGTVAGKILNPHDKMTLPEFCENRFRLRLGLPVTTIYRI